MPALPGAAELTRALGRWLIESAPAAPPPSVSAALSAADREVLALALERGVQHLLTGDAPLRREAQRHGVPCLGATDLVVLFKRAGLLSLVRPALDRMRAEGFGVDGTKCYAALCSAGE
ncbi:MAG TPA: hypothetical protein VK689_12020 [Armatimonadota bacterium]|nr:hypothetical protein [Armatimonadota bacterium]